MLPFPRISQYANTVEQIPVFLMKDFNTTADIIDKSPSAVPVTVYGNVPVGTDQYGTYMNFTGLTTQWLEFKSTKLDIHEAEIIFTIGNLLYRNTQYGTPLMDCRPYNVNGAYFSSSYTSNTAAPFAVQTVYNGSTIITSPYTLPAASAPVKITHRVRSTGTTVYYNDVLVTTNQATVDFVGQNFKIGRNAFIATAQVPYLYGKVYRIEIRKFT